MEFIICDTIIDPDGEMLPLLLAIILEAATLPTEDEDIAAELTCCSKTDDEILADADADIDADMLLALALGLTLPFTDCITHED